MNTDLLQNLEYGFKFCGSTAKFLTNPFKHLQNFNKKKTQLKQIYGYSEYSIDFECCRNEK